MRVQERFAHLVFSPEEGTRIGFRGSVRKVRISTSDPRVNRIIDLNRELRALGDGSYFTSGWQFIRRYTKAEIEAAEVFKLNFTKMFEPDGTECGTFLRRPAEAMDDVAPSAQHVGSTRPIRHLFISPRLYRILGAERVKGIDPHVAYFGRPRQRIRPE